MGLSLGIPHSPTPLAQEPVYAQPPNAFAGRFQVISVAAPGTRHRIAREALWAASLRTHGVEADVIANAFEVAVAAAATMRDHDRHRFLKTLAEAAGKQAGESTPIAPCRTISTSSSRHLSPTELATCAAWADFFTTEVLTWNGLVTFCTLFVIELRSRSVHVCGTTVSPNAHWMRQVARQLLDAADGFALGKTHLIIDRDTKYAEGFCELLESAGVKIVLCPPRVPQCNAYAERFVRSIKEECLSRLVFFNEGHLRKTISIFIDHYRHLRNHQGVENKLIEPPELLPKTGHIHCQKSLGEVLTYYYREAA